MRQEGLSDIKYQLYIDTSEILNKLLLRIQSLREQVGESENSFLANRLSVFIKGYGTIYIFNIAKDIFNYSKGVFTVDTDYDSISFFNNEIKGILSSYFNDSYTLDSFIRHMEHSVQNDLLAIFNSQFGNRNNYDIINLRTFNENKRILIFEISSKSNSF